MMIDGDRPAQIQNALSRIARAQANEGLMQGAEDVYITAYEEAMRLNEKMREAAAEMMRLSETVQRCVTTASELSSAAAPYSAEIMESLEAISIAVRASAKQFEKISVATIALSAQSAARMAEGLQHYIGQFAQQPEDPR